MEQTSTKKMILKTAAITLTVLILVSVMSVVIISFCVPYEGYKFTSNMGMKKSALFFAERYESNGNIDGLVYCLQLDDELYTSTGKTKYIDKLIAHTEKFFDYENVDDYFAQLDEYYIKESLPQYRVGLYSYYEHVVSRNYTARTALDKGSYMIFRGKPTKLDDIFKVEDMTLTEKAVVYSALYKAIGQAKEFKPFLNDKAFTDFYSSVKKSIPAFVDELNQSEGDALKTLFLLKSVIYLIDGTKAFLEANELADPDFDIAINELTYNGKALNKAYSDMYLAYIKN